MDFARKLMGNNDCSEQFTTNPLSNMVNAMLTPQPLDIVAPEDEFQDAWEEAELAPPMGFEEAWAEAPLEEAWEVAAHEEAMKAQEEEDDLEMMWQEMEDGIDSYLKSFNQAWNTPDYIFASSNSYLDCPNPFELSQEKMQSGLTPDAILCLEAEVQKNSGNSEAWTLLGKLHLENDDDSKAIAANIRGLEVDPYNLPLLMNLGVSFTNNMDPMQAEKYLRTWLENHPDYCSLPLPEDLKEAFKMAVNMNPNDSDAFQALGVLHFLDQELEQAQTAFREAAGIAPDQATLWNKLGASLAKGGKSDEGLECYYKALQLRPDYVRTWVNIGIAYSSMQEYYTAARFYLCALALNPEAENILPLLTGVFFSMDRVDLIEKLQHGDPMAFSDEFNIVTREQLLMAKNWGS